MDKSLGRMISNIREQKQMTNIRNERDDITIDSIDNKRIIRKHKQF